MSARQRQELIDEFRVSRDLVAEDAAPAYNVAPTDPVYAVLTRDGRELRRVRWGLVPSWAADPRAGARLINARAETVAVKPSFRSAFSRRRCLIPADGYYEWVALEGAGGAAAGPGRRGRARKQPYYICRADGGVLAFAGIYERWRDPELPGGQGWLWTAAIITTRATDGLGRIHDRMPMVVSTGQWDEWLDPATRDAGVLHAAMVPAASGGLQARPVSAAVNRVGNDGPDLIAAVTPAGPGTGPPAPPAGAAAGGALF